MVKRMGRYKCKCAKGSHERCQGGETCRTGFYNCKLARCIIKSLCPSLSSKFQNISTHPDKPPDGAGSIPKKTSSKAVVDVHKPPIEAALRDHAQIKPSDLEAAIRAIMQMKPSTEAARVVKKPSSEAAPAKDKTLDKYRHTYNDIVKNHLHQIDKICKRTDYKMKNIHADLVKSGEVSGHNIFYRLLSLSAYTPFHYHQIYIFRE